MLYTIRRLPSEPIFIVTLKPPMSLLKDIYSIDEVIDGMMQKVPGIVYRIDDFSALRDMDFTFSDAVLWLTGVLRDESYWSGRLRHVGVSANHINKLAQRICDEKIDHVRVTLFPTMPEAVRHARMEIARRSHDDR